MQIKTLAILPIILALTACGEKTINNEQISQLPNSDIIQTATANEVKKAEGIWIDVRSDAEFNSGHLDGAVNIPHEVIGDKISDLVKDKHAPIHLYCRSGRRAEIAKTTLTNMGYTNVVNHGGYDDLVKKGLK